MSVIGSTNCIFSITRCSRENEKSFWFTSSVKKSSLDLRFPRIIARVSCKISGENSETGTIGVSLSSKNKMEEYNTALKRLMRSPYEYHHDLGMNYTLIRDELIVGLQPQKPEDIDHLKLEESVAYLLNLQQDKDIEYWGIDLESIVRRCKELGIRHMSRPAKDFDPLSLRSQLPKVVSSLEWTVSEGKGRVYVHCTAGLGRASTVSIAYMYWFCNMNLLTTMVKTWDSCRAEAAIVATLVDAVQALYSNRHSR